MCVFEQGVIALLVTFICSIWGVLGSGGPEKIITKLKIFNSTCSWTVPNKIPDNSRVLIRITDPKTNREYNSSEEFLVINQFNKKQLERSKNKTKTFVSNGKQTEKLLILFPTANDTLFFNENYNIVWTAGKTKKLVNIEYSIDKGKTWEIIEKNRSDGQSWRINPFSFTGMFTGQFPVFWVITMMIIALIGGFGMGTNIDWYTEAQRIQSAKTVRDASYSIWAGTALVLVRNSIWAAAILGFFVLFPHLSSSKEYEMGWYIVGFKYLPIGMVGFFFAGILAIHLSTVSTQLNLGAMYATRDFYHHYVNPKASENKLVKVGRISTLIILVGSFIFGTIIGEAITQWLIFALWIMAAGVWLPNILQVIWLRFNSWGYLSAWIANLGLSWLVVWILPRFAIIPEFSDYLQFWILIVLNAMIYLPITLLTKPEKMEHLIKYYVMSRPIGFWKPVKKKAIQQGLLQ